MSTPKKFFPVSSNLIRKAINVSNERLIINIMEIDQSIFILNDLLERAQPLFSGRLVFKFIKDEEWWVDGVTEYEFSPVPGKMVKFTSGRWRFVKLDKVDKYEKLSDLRVGKSADSDALVRKLIDSIEEMLEHRKKILANLRSTRTLATGYSVSVSKRSEEMTRLAIKMNGKIKIDWRENVEVAIEEYREMNRQRYEKRKDRLKNKRDATKNTPLAEN